MKTKTRRPVDQVNDRLHDVGELARGTAAAARERASDVAEAVEPAARRARSTLSDVSHRAMGASMAIPAVVSKMLALLATLTGGLAERGREAADRIEPSTGARRRSRTRTALWFLGGFGAGAATGWALHARSQAAAPSPFAAEDTPSPYGDEARIIDARRANADVS